MLEAFRLDGARRLHTRCVREQELGLKAAARMQQLVMAGDLDLKLVPCSCAPGTEGSDRCNYGRACGMLTSHGEDVILMGTCDLESPISLVDYADPERTASFRVG